MGRLCERPGCSEPAGIAYGFDARARLVWLALRVGDDEYRSGVLCRRHADAMVVPIGWVLDDRRENRPRLFRAAPVDPDDAPRPAPAKQIRRKRAAPPPADELPLAGARAAEPAAPPEPEPGTVAAVTGVTSTDDPDATQAIPWNPHFDEDDDLGGVLAADSPLLARAFRGADRPRP